MACCSQGTHRIGGQLGGHQILLDLLLRHFQALGVTAANIVAVPGNHDVPRTSPPSSNLRYEEFTQVWRKAGCVTPWLDGVDPSASDGGPHQLVSENRLWAVTRLPVATRSFNSREG